MRYPLILMAMIAVSGCTPPPPVDASREALWSQFGGKPLDSLLLAWGAPERESHLTDGSRLVTYHHATIYDSRYNGGNRCEVSFLAKAPAFKISDVAMNGAASDCDMLAKGRVGDVVVPMAADPIYPAYMGPYPYPYRRYPF